jgi:hypothetical protein
LVRLVRFWLFLALVAFLEVQVVQPAELPSATQSEINHLLDFMENSHCQFYRNGKWYTDPKAVREHVVTKYQYFLEKGKINSAEDFIKWSATKSELSGKPYQVKCGDGPPVPVEKWLNEELARYRREKGGQPAR